MIILSLEGIRSQAESRPAGYYEDVVSRGVMREDGFIEFEQAVFDELVRKYSPDASRLHASGPTSGAGTELKKLLSSIGITATPNCSCNARAADMDRNGVEWCESNIDTIVEWLREEAEKRGLPFVDLAGRLLVRRAIRNARRDAAN